MSLLGAFLLPASCVMALDSTRLSVDKWGEIKAGDAEISVIHFGPGWNSAMPGERNFAPDKGYPQNSAKNWTSKGVFETKSGKFSLEETVTMNAADDFTVNISLKADAPVETNELALMISLPTEKFAGRVLKTDDSTVTFPAEFSEDKAVLLRKDSLSSFSIQCQDFRLVISGGKGLLVQDDRKYKQDNYGLRIKFEPSNGQIKDASISFNIKTLPYDTKTISLKSAVNFDFKDDVAGDAKGGWTDQGPENDLRMFKPGFQTLGGVAFDIINPAANSGKSCIVFGGDKIPGTPSKASVEVPNLSMKYLCVLHALGWPPATKAKIGSVIVTYADGTSKSFPVSYTVEAGNWWSPESTPNGEVVWTGENKSSYVGLYMSSFPVENKPVVKVDFENDGNSIWMIAGLSASNDEIPKLKNVPCYVVESANWKPFEYARDVQKGSILDFSFLQDAPAGKYGKVIIKDGKFVFEKNSKPQRFYGTNLCFTANYLSKETAERLADRLAALGYNSVRFHHFDNQLVKKTATSSVELNPAEADKLDYLVKCLKDKGIYMTVDVYISRIPVKGEIPELGDKDLSLLDLASIKAAMLISDTAMDNFEAYAKNFFNHVNPYTGLAWKDEPALCFVSLINEDTVFSGWNRSPSVKAVYDAKFKEWLAAKSIVPANDGERSKYMSQFLIEIYAKAYKRMDKFMKSIGVTSPLTDQNMWDNVLMAVTRDQYDYVDNHFYWDHPRFPVTPWRLPMAFTSKSAILSMAGCPSGSFPTRIFGKPFTITEFNYCFPNATRAEGGALAGAYAALQDWDGMYRFGYSHSANGIEKGGPAGLFDSAVEPMQYMSEKLAVMLFLRGDVKPSALKIPLMVKADAGKDVDVYKHYSKLSRNLGLLGQVGTVVDYNGKAAIPADASKVRIDAASNEDDAVVWNSIKNSLDMGKGKYDFEKSVIRSTTGEIEIDGSAGTLKVMTPKTEAFITSNAGKLDGANMTINNKSAFAAISASAIDNIALADSKRILVLHLTNVMNSKTKFSNKTMTMMESAGSLPLLALRGVADITLKLSPGATPKVYGIDMTGARVAEVPSKFENGTLSFTADTFGLKTPCFAYEIAR